MKLQMAQGWKGNERKQTGGKGTMSEPKQNEARWSRSVCDVEETGTR